MSRMIGLIGTLLFLMVVVDHASAFTYEISNLEKDLRSAQEVVVAAKIGGRIPISDINAYRSALNMDHNEIWLDRAWSSLQSYNEGIPLSAFMVIDSISGSLKEGDIFYADDEWITIPLGSTAVYFLTDHNRKKNVFHMNPCHRISFSRLENTVKTSS